MKIKRDLGHLEGHWLVEIYELEDGRCICVKEILEPCSFDDDGEPLQYDLIGFEEV